MQRRELLAGVLGAGSIGVTGCSGQDRSGPTEESEKSTLPESSPKNGYFRIETGPDNEKYTSVSLDSLARDRIIVESFESGLDSIKEIRLSDNQSYDLEENDWGHGNHALEYHYGATGYVDSSPTKGILHRPMPVVGASKLSVSVKTHLWADDSFRIGWGYDGVDGFAISLELNSANDFHMVVGTAAERVDLGTPLGASKARLQLANLDWTNGTGVVQVGDQYNSLRLEREFEFEPVYE